MKDGNMNLGPHKTTMTFTEIELEVLQFALADSIVLERERAAKYRNDGHTVIANNLDAKCAARQRLLDRVNAVTVPEEEGR